MPFGHQDALCTFGSEAFGGGVISFWLFKNFKAHLEK
jgi:hypothetical protein